MKTVFTLAAVLTLSVVSQAQTFKTLECFKAANPQALTISPLDKKIQSENVTEAKMKIKKSIEYGNILQVLKAKSKTLVFNTGANIQPGSKHAGIDCDGGGWDIKREAKTGNLILTAVNAVGEVSKNNGEGCGNGILSASAPLKMIKVPCTK